MPEITTKLTKKGFSLKLKHKKIINTELSYPKQIWQTYDKKDKLIRNLAYLLTLPLPLVARFKKIFYNTPEPEFKRPFQKLMLKDLPSSTFEYKQDLKKYKKQFLSLKINFSKKPIKTKKPIKIDSEAISLLSFGKDSLLSLAIAKEISLNPIALHINDTVSPSENKLKIKFMKKLTKENNLKGHIITNSIEKLNDFETWNRAEMSLNYAHMVTGFGFIALPLAHFYNSHHIILGNEKNFDFYIRKNGEKIYPSYDQTTEWTKKLDKMVKEFADVKVFSVIRPITDLAITKILHSRYPNIAKYQHSCYGLDASTRKRWCHDCSSCMGCSLFMTAFGINPRRVGLRKFFSKKNRKHYTLFNPKCPTIYDLIFSKEQELLMLLFALRNKEKGYIIDKFRKKYLKEALTREDELRKKFFRIYASRIPSKLKPKILSIYKEELKDLV
ncbi:MAG: hypothetical protein IB618_03095 [Candidatus Pacearchaeota archaeon]|nr:MAG: hypothetical protein IB618_03095 [Candidatus Pacearchaeota archaeon]